MPTEESALMALLRQYLWLWVVFGMVFVSVAISIVFLFLCKCISRRGKHRIIQLKKEANFKTESNKYQERNIEAGIPPLPPRTQFLTAETQSYENLAEEHDYEESQSIHDYEDGNCEQNVSHHEDSIHDYEESTDLQPDYVKMEGEVILPPPPPYNSMGSSALEAQSYENLAEENEYEESQSVHDYEESTDNQPDYVKVDDEDQAGDDTSTEDYDDIGGEDQDEEDYDDVG